MERTIRIQRHLYSKKVFNLIFQGSGQLLTNRPLLEVTMLALHIIMGAGYGVSFTWDKQTTSNPWPNHTLSFKDAVLGLIEHLLPIVLIPKVFWRLPFHRMKRMKRDYEEFGQYLRDLLGNPKGSGEDTGLGENLISALARSAEMEKGDGSGSSVGLSDDQILGNAFMFLVAGHETTYLPPSPVSTFPNIHFL